MTGYTCLNSRLPLAGKVAMELGLEWDYDALSCRFFFAHRAHGVVYSCDGFEAGPWVSELRSAIDLLNTFSP
jgi:hypothetical protein